MINSLGAKAGEQLRKSRVLAGRTHGIGTKKGSIAYS